MSSLLDIPRSTVSDIIRKWKRLGTTATQPRSGRQRKITERGQRLLRHMVCKSRQRSAESIAKGFRASTGINVSTKTVWRELHGMGFHGRAAACRPHITKFNAKRPMEWCKAHRHWTVFIIRNLHMVYSGTYVNSLPLLQSNCN